jgi:predicted nucleic acid-binding Zn ribbon protein
MTQPTLPNRKLPVFVRCPVCGTEFRRNLDQRWCSRDCAQDARRRARRAPPKRQTGP